MKRVIVVLVLMAFCLGCTTVKNVARVLPDGTKELEQTVKVSAGGKLKKGMLEFTAESILKDGSNWTVTSGARSEDAWTPNVIKDVRGMMSDLTGLLGPLLAPATPAPAPTTEINLSP